MLTLYTGTPGSGKSYHATERIDIWLRQGKNVISTYPIKVNKHHKRKRYLSSVDDEILKKEKLLVNLNHIERYIRSAVPFCNSK